jgi:hypothetical protein
LIRRSGSGEHRHEAVVLGGAAVERPGDTDRATRKAVERLERLASDTIAAMKDIVDERVKDALDEIIRGVEDKVTRAIVSRDRGDRIQPGVRTPLRR